jgi:hypothetical protein
MVVHMSGIEHAFVRSLGFERGIKEVSERRGGAFVLMCSSLLITYT